MRKRDLLSNANDDRVSHNVMDAMATALSGHDIRVAQHAHAEPWAWYPIIRMLRCNGLIKLAALFLIFAIHTSIHAESALNTLTEKEKHDGWQLLFDGRTTKGWMTIGEKPLPDRHVQNGCLNPHPCDYMLVYESPLENYVLSLDFKISSHCNSGIFVRTMPLTRENGRDVGYNGIEIAIDDTKTAGYTDTGAFYDLVKPQKNAMKPVGEWNHIVITSDRNRMSVALNGELMSQIDFDQWREPNKRPDGTAHKFDVAYKNHPRKGYIGLQDHGSDCWFRNIKLKRMP